MRLDLHCCLLLSEIGFPNTCCDEPSDIILKAGTALLFQGVTPYHIDESLEIIRIFGWLSLQLHYCKCNVCLFYVWFLLMQYRLYWTQSIPSARVYSNWISENVLTGKERMALSMNHYIYNLVLWLIKTSDSELLLLNLHWFYSDWAVCEEDPVWGAGLPCKFSH